MSEPAQTVEQFLAALPPPRRAAAEALLATIRAHLPQGFAERMNYGMVTFTTAGGLALVSVADHGYYGALYVNCVEPGAEERLYARWRATGTPLETGSRAVRFRDAGDLALEVVGEFVAGGDAEALAAAYGRARRPPPPASRPPARR
ncbi:DUF1801 domain-containing protein [Conexibacter stalactiti]|uniref:YdhG-like domain-containing protein n=1 Tax=Conexibacter stalactiti TaxID=1940611 RepID=A0ABU4HND7_9ACTN|nr:DUF1801 domain-containing protein [Conexibacter stalactiti]MDW5594821.1 hypothetical protein [Conexibacter stalactiti]MEC5035463.1 DUF1801 domain-containing protein [Conexibacter stalactiti]